MADDFLGRKMEEYRARTSSGFGVRTGVNSIGALLQKSRSYRGFDDFVVREDQLRRIIDVNTKTPSARNQQVLRFRPVLAAEAAKVLPHIRLGGALPDLCLPIEGAEPKAYIVVCSIVAQSRYVDIDLGISAQSMLLQAAEIGLNGVCIAAFNKQRIMHELGLELEPQLIIGLGHGNEKIELVTIRDGENQSYYRENGVHYVPKICLDDLIVKG